MLIPKEKCAELDDRALIRRSLEEVDYFSCLYQRYEARLLRYIHRLIRVSDAEAEDILQESFIKVWKNLHGFDPSLKLSSWIYRIVHNQTISCLRKKSAYGKDQDVVFTEGRYGDLADEATSEFPGDSPNREDLVNAVLDQLPQPYKEILVLKFLENMSYTEISDVLKIPEGTVATRINRAKKAFAAVSKDQHLVFDL